jgi:hypothetical protein
LNSIQQSSERNAVTESTRSFSSSAKITAEWPICDRSENLEQSNRVQAVIDFYGPTDFLQNAFAANGPNTPEAQLIGGAILEFRDDRIASMVTKFLGDHLLGSPNR